MDQVSPVIERASGNLVENLKVEDVDSFEYVRYCWYESMRLQPPVPGSLSNQFVKTVNIAGVDFLPHTSITINFTGI
jgi:cytochrome P450